MDRIKKERKISCNSNSETELLCKNFTTRKRLLSTMMLCFLFGEKTNRVRVAISVFGCSSVAIIMIKRPFTQTVTRGKDKTLPNTLFNYLVRGPTRTLSGASGCEYTRDYTICHRPFTVTGIVTLCNLKLTR